MPPKCNYLSCLLCLLWSVTGILDFHALFWIFPVVLPLIVSVLFCLFFHDFYGLEDNIHVILRMSLGPLYVIAFSHDYTKVVCLGESILELEYPSHCITSRICDNHTIPMMLKFNYLGMSIFCLIYPEYSYCFPTMKTDSKANRFLRQKQQIPDFGKGSLFPCIYSKAHFFYLVFILWSWSYTWVLLL